MYVSNNIGTIYLCQYQMFISLFASVFLDHPWWKVVKRSRASGLCLLTKLEDASDPLKIRWESLCVKHGFMFIVTPDVRYLRVSSSNFPQPLVSRPPAHRGEWRIWVRVWWMHTSLGLSSVNNSAVIELVWGVISIKHKWHAARSDDSTVFLSVCLNWS